MSAGTQKSKRDIPTSIIEADIGEPPDVAEPHGQAEAREEELTVIVPALSLRHLVVHNIHPCFLVNTITPGLCPTLHYEYVSEKAGGWYSCLGELMQC